MVRQKTIYLSIVVMLFVGIATSYAQRKEVISGEAVFYCGEQFSKAEGKKMAYNQAVIKALADKYGTTVTSTMQRHTTSVNGYSTEEVDRLDRSEVSGEWIGDTKEPEYKFDFDDNGNLVIRVKVEGETRRVGNDKVSLNVKALRNGTTHQHASKEFHHDDDLYVCLEGNANGYIAIYYVDGKDAYCMLPYRDDPDGEEKIKSGKHYIFFSEKDAPKEQKDIATSIYVTYEEGFRLHKLFVIYSPNPFRKAVDHRDVNGEDDGYDRPNSLPQKDFDRWLTNLKSHDPEMRVESLHLDIFPK